MALKSKDQTSQSFKKNFKEKLSTFFYKPAKFIYSNLKHIAILFFKVDEFKFGSLDSG